MLVRRLVQIRVAISYRFVMVVACSKQTRATNRLTQRGFHDLKIFSVKWNFLLSNRNAPRRGSASWAPPIFEQHRLVEQISLRANRALFMPSSGSCAFQTGSPPPPPPAPAPAPPWHLHNLFTIPAYYLHTIPTAST